MSKTRLAAALLLFRSRPGGVRLRQCRDQDSTCTYWQEQNLSKVVAELQHAGRRRVRIV